MGAACTKNKSKGASGKNKNPNAEKITQSSHEINDSNNKKKPDDMIAQELPSASVQSQRSLSASRLVQRSSVFDSRPGSLILQTTIATSKENIHKVYKIENRIIGHGHFGTVRLGSLLSNPGKYFAIKTILKEKLNGQTHLLLREIDILKAIDHPNIVKFYEIYQDPTNLHIVMEYCSGGDLIDLLEEKSLSEEETKKIIKKALAAIKHLHEKGIAHRDLKLENFLFADKTPDSEIKLIDFGLAKRYNVHKPARLNSFVGTPFYVAPEIFEGPYNEKCDEWSLGVMMYILLCNRPPFDGKTDEEIFENIRFGMLDLSLPPWDKISVEAKDFLCKLLARNPEQRISSFQAANHSWLRTSTASTLAHISSKLPPDEILQNILSFKRKNGLRREILNSIVPLINEDVIKKLLASFRLCDLNNTGELTAGVLKEIFHEAGFVVSTDEIRQQIKEISIDQKEKIRYSDFLVAAMDIKEVVTKERLTIVFNKYDIERCNTITVQNLKEMMTRSGRKISDTEIADMLQEAGIADNQSLHFKEFCALMDFDIADDDKSSTIKEAVEEEEIFDDTGVQIEVVSARPFKTKMIETK